MIRVTLQQEAITRRIICRVNDSPRNISMLSLRGAQREITGALISEGCSPTGLWQRVESDSGQIERWFDS
jgi:hypothetical protein